MRASMERLGRGTVNGIEEIGYAAVLLAESLYWVIVGAWRRQPVRMSAVIDAMVETGVRAAPIVVLLAFANGVMMAVQGIHNLRDFGAELEVVPRVALWITREFGALIAAVVIAGRSGSAITARIGAMQLAQEIDALRVMGVNPVRYLVSPLVLALLLMAPVLTVLADTAAILGGALLGFFWLQLELDLYLDLTLAAITVGDVMQGVGKSLVFGVLIAVISCVNGFSARGGALGLGRATTRSVVSCIAAVVLCDMVFAFYLGREQW